MKFIHTSDLHLGRKLNDISLISDQQFILNDIVNKCIEKNVDFLLISGDIYDKSVPSNEAMMLFDSFINNLVKKNIKVFAISGNHDSDCKINYFSDILRNSNINMCGIFKGELEKHELTDEFGKYNVYLLPFIKYQNVRKYYDEEINNYDDAIRCIINNSDIDYNSRNIILSHQFITGAVTCDSEELSLGGIDNVSYTNYENFDYVALGHIHRAQKFVKEHIRYSGSIYKYSISEETHTKSVVYCEIKEKNDINIELLPLKSLHEVRSIKGLYNDIMNMPFSYDYVSITLTDEDIFDDYKSLLQVQFPNMIKFAIENSKTSYTEYFSNTEEINTNSFKDLFVEFYKMQNGNQEPTDEHLKIVDEIFEDLGE